MSVYICLKTEGGCVPQIKLGKQLLRIHARIQQRGGIAQGIAVDLGIAKAPGIGDNARIQQRGGFLIHAQLMLKMRIERRDHLAAGGAVLLHPGKVRVGVAVGVVVDLDQLAAQGVFGVGDALRVARIHHDAQGVLIGIVRQYGIVEPQES